MFDTLAAKGHHLVIEEPDADDLGRDDEGFYQMRERFEWDPLRDVTLAFETIPVPPHRRRDARGRGPVRTRPA